MRDAKLAAVTGKAGEYIVAGQILLRLMPVLWPAVDMGYDLMTETGCRVQIKTAHLYAHKNGPRYFFPLPKFRRIPNSDKTTKLVAKKSFADICDVVVFYGIEQNRFWIVPSHLCDAVVGIELGLENTQRRFAGSISDMREMRSLGYSYGAIGNCYGLEKSSVKQFIDSGRDSVDETIVSQMRACEGRWENILDFVRPAAAIEAPAIKEE